ncbi:MAG: DUF1207 domain-containing protein [Bacteroidota bacterium]|nr:DUF1207 domain-containing protein [Bacteroidota bacterium]
MFLLSTLFCSAGDFDSLITFLPKQKYISTFTANGNEHRISYNKLMNRNSLIGSMGGIFPMANIQFKELDAQVSIASSIYTFLNSAGIRFQVVNVDFFVDMYADIKLSPATTARIGWGHTSQHFADDAFESLGYTKSINYARDYYQLFFIHQIPLIKGFVYGGTYYNHSFLIDKRIDGEFLWEAGGEFLNIPITGPINFYSAIDIKLRSELAYGSTQSYQTGIKVQNESLSAIRLAYTYRTGIEERGQFYNQRNTYHTIGMFFDF